MKCIKIKWVSGEDELVYEVEGFQRSFDGKYMVIQFHVPGYGTAWQWIRVEQYDALVKAGKIWTVN